MSVRRVTAHVRAVWEQFSELSDADQNHRILHSLISLLSYGLRVVSSCHYTPESPDGCLTEELESESPADSGNAQFKHAGSIPVKQAPQLLRDILQTASDLMLVR